MIIILLFWIKNCIYHTSVQNIKNNYFKYLVKQFENMQKYVASKIKNRVKKAARKMTLVLEQRVRTNSRHNYS